MSINSIFLIFLLLINLQIQTRHGHKDPAENLSISITIDDLPAVSYINSYDQRVEITDGVIQALTRHKVPGIGFVNEGKLYQNESLMKREVDLLQKWVKNGLTLGNHGFRHLDINSVEFPAYLDDILKGEEITIRLMAGSDQKVKYYRHPFLRKGNTPEKKVELEKYLNSINYREAPVTVDNSEWIFAKAYSDAVEEQNELLQKKIGETYLDYMMEKTAYYQQQSEALFGQSIPHILLIHANLLNAHYLDQLLERYEDQGFNFPSLDETLKHKAYQSKDEYVGNSGISWVHRWAMAQGKKGDFFKGEPTCPEFIQETAGIRE